MEEAIEDTEELSKAKSDAEKLAVNTELARLSLSSELAMVKCDLADL